MVARDVPLAAARASAPRSAPLLFNMVGLHWQGSGQVWFRTADRPGHFGPLAPGAARGGGHTRPRERGARRERSLARRQPVVDRRRALDRISRDGLGHAPADILRRQPGHRRRPRACRHAHAAAAVSAAAAPLAQPPIVRRSGWSADESIVRGAALDRRPPPLRGRPPHRRVEQLLGLRVRGDRPRHPALPRAQQRLGRHRLQLPRRQVRPRLRGPRRRHRRRT